MISDTNAGYGAGTTTHLDFNGDGRQDIALEMAVRSCSNCVNTNMTYYELLSGSSSFSAQAIATVDNSSLLKVYFLNFNSDRCTDYAVYSTLYISGCNGVAATSIAIPGGADMIGAMDWNGDGHTDILVQNGSTIGVYLSEGNALDTTEITTSIPYNSSYGYFTFDPYGGGMQSLGVLTNSGIIYYPNNSPEQPPDLLTKITDGYGNWIEPSYVSLAHAGSAYAPDGSATTGYEDYMGPYYITNQVKYSDPANPPNATYTKTYSYYGAQISTNGRGFADFGAKYALDSRNNLYTAYTYDHVFPYTGMLLSRTVTEGSAGGQRVSYQSNSLNDLTLQSTQYEERYFPYVSSSTTERYGISGSDNGSLVTTEAQSYSYDQTSGDLKSYTKTLTDDDSGSPYNGYSWTSSVSNTPAPNTGTWCLSLLTAITTSYRDTYDNSSVSISRNLTPDTSSCHYTSIVTAPNTSYQVTDNLSYDNFGNIDSNTVTGTGMAARTTSVSWGTTGQFPTSITDALGESTTLNYDFGCGTVSSETDPNVDVTEWQYGDGFCRLTRETMPDGTYTTWGYSLYAGSDPIPRMVITQDRYDTAGNVIRTSNEQMDMEDRPYRRQAQLLDGSMATVMQQTYDALGRVVSAQEPFEGNTVGAFSYSYDILNRLTEKQRPTSASDSTPAVTSYQYSGLLSTITDPNGDVRTLVYDPNGWLRRTTDDLGYAVTLGYDAAGSRTSVTDNESNTLWSGTWQYGLRPFLIATTSMDMGSWAYTVDPLGEITGWSDAKGQQFTETYDALSRPLTRSEPDYFTQWTWGASSSAHDIGRIASICTVQDSAPTSCSNQSMLPETQTWTYDSFGRQSTQNIVLPNGSSYTYSWQYSPTTGFLSERTYPATDTVNASALALQYGYAYGYLKSITDTLASPNIVLWSADSMNPARQVTQETLGNGVVTSRAYDAVTHLLTAVQSGVNGGAALQNEDYLYDADGNLIQRQNNNRALTESFFYDGDNRLINSTLNGTSNLTVAYNSMGDITSRSDISSGAAWTYDSSRKHQVTEAGSSAYQYAYDANGNMTSWNGNAITWTSFNQPNSITDSATGETITRYYAGQNHHPWEVVSDSSSGYIYSEYVGNLFDLVMSPTQGYANFRNYVYAGNEPVAVDSISTSDSGDGTIDYFLTGPQRSVTALTNASGQLVIDEDFSAFGAERNATTWSGAPSSSDLSTILSVSSHGYTFDRALTQQMSLNDMVGRIEDSTLGRFLSADPTVPYPDDSQSYNSYSYVENNPMTYVDPTGFANNLSGHGTYVCQDCSTPPPANLPTALVQGTYQPSLSSNVGLVTVASSSSINSDIGEALGGRGGFPLQQPSKGKPQSNPPKPTKTTGACSDLSSFQCQACVTTYLNNTYGTFGGFIANTFNAQQAIPGLSGQSLFKTLAPTAEIGLAKFGAGQGLQFGGDFIAMNTSGAGGFWAGTSLEYAGAMVAPVLGVFGAATTPFATVAMSNARSACGG